MTIPQHYPNYDDGLNSVEFFPFGIEYRFRTAAALNQFSQNLITWKNRKALPYFQAESRIIHPFQKEDPLFGSKPDVRIYQIYVRTLRDPQTGTNPHQFHNQVEKLGLSSAPNQRLQAIENLRRSMSAV